MIGATARERHAELPAAVRRRRPAGAIAASTSTGKLFVVRKRVEHEVTGDQSVYFPSLSCRTLVYKGMLTTPQLARVLPRPQRRAGRVGAGAGAQPLLARTRSRRGRSPTRTGTSPTTARSTPCRATATGCAPARRCCESDRIPGDLERAFPICTPGGIRHGQLRRGARAAAPRRPPDLPHAVLMMIPEAWENHATMSRREARVLPLPRVADGAVGRPGVDRVHRRHRDRRGARPQRPAPEPLLGHRRRPRDHGVRGRRGRRRPARVVQKGRLQPGRMFLVDTAQGRIVDDDEIKAELAAEQPYARVARRRASCTSTTCPTASTSSTATSRCCGASRCSATRTRSSRSSSRRWRRTGAEAIGSMGTDTPIAVLSDRPRLLFDYFQQLFAQVTNPPLDAIREELVTSLSVARSGPRATCSRPARQSCRQIELPFPIIDNDELAKLIHINDDGDRAGLRGARHLRAVPRRRRRRRRCARRSTRVRAEASAGDRRGRAHPRALRPRLRRGAARRSRRCCSRRRCTTT